MRLENTARYTTRVTRIACACLVLLVAGATIARAPAPASASPPTALELVDHALTSPALLADESPYELIDPIGPGGITRDQAVGEVTASTMIGGLYNDGNHYGGAYGGGEYLMPALPDGPEPHAYGGSRPVGQWGGGYSR